MAFLRDDRDYHVERTTDRPVVVREERRGGWGWLATLLTLAALALILWATGILNVDTNGSVNDESLRGGADVQLNDPNIDFNVDPNPNDNAQ